MRLFPVFVSGRDSNRDKMIPLVPVGVTNRDKMSAQLFVPVEATNRDKRPLFCPADTRQTFFQEKKNIGSRCSGSAGHHNHAAGRAAARGRAATAHRRPRWLPFGAAPPPPAGAPAGRRPRPRHRPWPCSPRTPLPAAVRGRTAACGHASASRGHPRRPWPGHRVLMPHRDGREPSPVGGGGGELVADLGREGAAPSSVRERRGRAAAGHGWRGGALQLRGDGRRHADAARGGVGRAAASRSGMGQRRRCLRRGGPHLHHSWRDEDSAVAGGRGAAPRRN
ncbi:hypothetical protein PVAP13_9NG550414 [Panicum virgatum]|uniref:Uncharacterized protein n=1 Tax=Panicum virgatum TaxID=38727 RepID=A0A8T0MXQ4_PANVG|nr:hypothetical protein PVAP13_9NG550414 [Panicum virgatum]